MLQVFFIASLLQMMNLWTAILGMTAVFAFAAARKVCYDQYELYVLTYGEDAE